METEFIAVIGRGYGDEGKGFATDYLAQGDKPCLVVKHNGGAQAGHTVEMPGKRFVFHELSSGSFRQADTFWAETYLPDLYKLAEESEDFRREAGFVPGIYADEKACITIIDDVLINMAIETKRGAARHGSCGMGINEADLRTKAGYGITIGMVCSMEEEMLLRELKKIRRVYLPLRLKQLGLKTEEMGEYGELLQDDTILHNFAAQVKENVKLITPVESPRELFEKYRRVIFESGQGLLLDSEWEESLPHVTASRTGLTNPLLLLRKAGKSLNRVVYVTRSYLTRHGAGPLLHECSSAELGKIEADVTNAPNPWQGNFRYARYDSVREFLRPVQRDLQQLTEPTKVTLLVTHLNETEGCIRFTEGDFSIEAFAEYPPVKEVFTDFLWSSSRYGCDENK